MNEKKTVVTLRLNSRGVEELNKIKEFLDIKTSTKAIEHMMLTYRSTVDQNYRNEKIIDGLQAQLENLH